MSLAGSGLDQFAAAMMRVGRKRPIFAMPPEPGYEKALREYTARLLAQGASVVPPSFTDFVGSGGKATFNMGNTALTPGEAVGLGEVGRGGQPVPFMQPGQTSLTPQQIMFIASLGGGKIGATPQIKQEGRQMTKLSTLESKPQTTGRTAKEEKLAGKISKEEGK